MTAQPAGGTVQVERHETDVLILGGGLAALRAALAATAGERTRVTIATKGRLGRGGSSVGAYGFAAVLRTVDPDDSIGSHIEDTMIGGSCINDRRLVEILCEEAPARVRELHELGARFRCLPDGRILQRPSGEHRHARMCSLDAPVGTSATLPIAEPVRAAGVQVLERVQVLDLVVHAGRVTGALLLGADGAGLLDVRAGSVVLGLGGAGRMYAVTSNPSDVTGDGYAVAYRAGAVLRDMEMVQFYPWRLIAPFGQDGRIPVQPVSFALGARLRDLSGERFMLAFDPERGEGTTRDVAARAIHEQMRSGRAVDGGALLDLREVEPAAFLDANPRIAAGLRVRGLALEDARLIVAPEAHFMMGGVRFGPDCSTDLPGLFVCGEVAGGVHGANRLNGNALSEAVVFGARAGMSAREHAAGVDVVRSPSDVVDTWRERAVATGARGDLAGIRAELRERMWRDCGITRTRPRLDALRRWLSSLAEDLSARSSGLGGMSERAELSNMVCTSMLVATSALAREKTCGAHFLEDAPTPDRGQRNILVERGVGGPQVRQTSAASLTAARVAGGKRPR